MRSMIVASTIAASTGCSPLPDVAYETERLQIAPDFDDPICEGTLQTLDDYLVEVELGLGRVNQQEPFRLYWLRDGIVDACGEGRGGCFFPATRVMFARGPSITHEMTHAVLDSEGESYFLEEGMAELLSGVGVYYDPTQDTTGPGDRLRLSRSSYRAGGFDYSAAAHFMRWIYDRRGIDGVRRLAYEVEDGASPARLEQTLEQVMGRPIDQIEVLYRHEAKRAYEGLGYERTPSLLVAPVDLDPERRGPEAYRVEVEARLDCGSEQTMGPLPDEREGMYQVHRMRVPANTGAVLRLEGDEDTWAYVFDPYASRRAGIMTDWMLPAPDVDHDAVELLPGDVVEAPLREGVWAVMLGSSSTEIRRVRLEIELVAAPPPGPPRDEPGA